MLSLLEQNLIHVKRSQTRKWAYPQLHDRTWEKDLRRFPHYLNGEYPYETLPKPKWRKAEYPPLSHSSPSSTSLLGKTSISTCNQKESEENCHFYNKSPYILFFFKCFIVVDIQYLY